MYPPSKGKTQYPNRDRWIRTFAQETILSKSQGTEEKIGATLLANNLISPGSSCEIV